MKFVFQTLGAGLLAMSILSPAAAPSSKSTLQNLQAAFNGESNAHARYLAFATKADQEKRPSVAALFRAAARAEEVHAANHATVIRQLGGVPDANIETVAAKSTRENLEAAVKGETYERDVMYPQFIKDARAANDKNPIQTFTYARTAEAEHAKLFSQALSSLGVSSDTKREYYVCPVCGYTTDKLDFNVCPSSGTPKDRYEKIS